MPAVMRALRRIRTELVYGSTVNTYFIIITIIELMPLKCNYGLFMCALQFGSVRRFAFILDGVRLAKGILYQLHSIQQIDYKF